MEKRELADQVLKWLEMLAAALRPQPRTASAAKDDRIYGVQEWSPFAVEASNLTPQYDAVDFWPLAADVVIIFEVPLVGRGYALFEVDTRFPAHRGQAAHVHQLAHGSIWL